MHFSNYRKLIGIFCFQIYICSFSTGSAAGNNPRQETFSNNLSVSTFDIDATPPVGSFLAYDQMVNSWDLGLRAKGIVLMGAGQPIVLCSVDWIGIANDSQDAFKLTLADAAGTVPDRVAVHTVHPHDAPVSDFGAERLLKEAGLNPLSYESSYQPKLIRKVVMKLVLLLQ